MPQTGSISVCSGLTAAVAAPIGTGGPPSVTTPPPAIGGRGAKYFAGSLRNFDEHPAQQKKYVFPPWSRRAGAFSGSTCIPQTGSRSINQPYLSLDVQPLAQSHLRVAS